MAQQLASNMVQQAVSTLLDRVEHQQDFSPDQARELLAGCAMSDAFLDRLWEVAQGFLDRGMESRKLAFLLKEFSDVLDLGIRVCDIAVPKVEAANLKPDEKTDGLAFLAQAARRTSERCEELSTLVRRLEAPPRQVELSSLPPAAEAPDAPGYVSLETLTERLLSRDK